MLEASPPRSHLLSNGSYSVMLTAAGSGYSRWRDIALTRWREDPTCDGWGYYLFLRDMADGRVWSAGYQPTAREPEQYDAAFFEDRVEFSRRDASILTRMEVVVASEDDAEVRRISLSNEGEVLREIEVTSYAEAVLSEPWGDSAHPAFSKMFVRTEFATDSGALLATRRPREANQPQLWMVHFATLEGEAAGPLQWETDRMRFIGRGRTLRDAAALIERGPLSNTVGTVLDPVVSLRHRVRIPAGKTVHVCFWMGIAAGRAQALSLVGKFGDAGAFERTRALSAAKAPGTLTGLGIEAAEACVFQDIAGRVLYSDASLRAPTEILDKNALGLSTLWSHGISGDRPIVAVSIDAAADLQVVGQLVRAKSYWQIKGLNVDLVVLNDAPPASAAALQTALDPLIKSSGAIAVRADAMPPLHRELLLTAARVLIVASRGPLSGQLSRPPKPTKPPPARVAPASNPPPQAGAAASAAELSHSSAALEFANGFGGFDAATREYVVALGQGQWTPLPWVNVIANPEFGFLVSADGVGSTWSLNAQQNQITPWCNDPVSNTPAEAVYIRDENSGDLWSAMPLPIRVPAAAYTIRHGFGYTRCENNAHGIAVDLLQFVPRQDSIKISRLKIGNRSAQIRRLSITQYVDWTLGNQNNRAAPFIVTEIHPRTGALLARNPWSANFRGRVAFLDMAARQESYTADRREFLGRHGSLAAPKVLSLGQSLSNRVGGGLDPCGAMQCQITLQPGETAELTLLLGEESSSAAAVALIERYRAMNLESALKEVTDFWDETLGALQVKTPDRSMDVMANGWLLYQTLVCRVWGRTAFYQSSGAYGYRDQLQDVMALCVAAPGIAREHILRAAAQQYAAGDVQHWWLPTSGQGIKTRVSDDRIWLAFVVARYLEVTGDLQILDAQVTFLAGGPLAPGVLESFSKPDIAGSAPLYEHCTLALDSSLSVGAHGLPLFGTGDWNDGMNRVGAAGRGESVWLGWFLYATLLRFAPIAEKRGAADKASAWRQHAKAVQQAIEREAWDGGWYRRGYYDDGSPLGSASDDECKIDSIAQSWAVISTAAEPGRAREGMAAVDAQLVDRDAAILKLFTPPFDRSAQDPGYIKAYPPGLRENGGQYTHAATWSVLAFALLGDGDKAFELFSFLNPIHHSRNAAAIDVYKVEPYVVCADVYSTPPHVGRGGWTWYTGSAGWLYRSGVEGILGFNLRGNVLKIDPCIPRAWPGFEMTYVYKTSRYRIAVSNPNAVSSGIAYASVDAANVPGPDCAIILIDDGREHRVEITLGR
jgi:cyclic beta-1,2-glucan synthetase